MIFAYLFRKINHFVSTGKLLRSFAPRERDKKSAPQADRSLPIQLRPGRLIRAEPSIMNIRRNAVVWGENMSKEDIEEGCARDRQARDQHFGTQTAGQHVHATGSDLSAAASRGSI